MAELAEHLGGVLVGDPEVEITGVAGIREAGPGDLTFLASPRYAAFADSTGAAAILVADDYRLADKLVIQLADPYAAFIQAAQLFRPPSPPPLPGIHPSAVVADDARIGGKVSIGPQVVIEAGACVGERTVVEALCFIGNGSELGPDCRIYPGVVIREDCHLGAGVVIHSGTVIGADGFGFAWDGSSHRKIPQSGPVVIEDDVEIGASCAIDRGTVGETRIGRGTRLDNLVHVGHNVRIGEHSLLIAQVGIGGSTRIGKHVTLAGQAGIVGHVEIGDGAQVGAQTGVISSVPAGERVWGYPAMPLQQSKRVYASIKRTPELLRELKALGVRVQKLEDALREAQGGDSALCSARQPRDGRDGQAAND